MESKPKYKTGFISGPTYIKGIVCFDKDGKQTALMSPKENWILIKEADKDWKENGVK